MKDNISNHKQLAMGKKAPVKLKAGGAVKGKPVKVKHVMLKKGGRAKKEC